MATSVETCLDALRSAAAELDESPSKAAYEELGMRPSSATIIRTVGGWNEAKRRAGLETATSTGSRTEPKPDGVDLSDDVDWDDLSVDQRWHYRNVDRNAERDRERKRRLRAWAYERKVAAGGCSDCGETDPRCLDFHHPDDTEKEASISRLINDLRSRDRIAAEMDKCAVVCANCHRKRHLTDPRHGVDSED